MGREKKIMYEILEDFKVLFNDLSYEKYININDIFNLYRILFLGLY